MKMLLVYVLIMRIFLIYFNYITVWKVVGVQNLNYLNVTSFQDVSLLRSSNFIYDVHKCSEYVSHLINNYYQSKWWVVFIALNLISWIRTKCNQCWFHKLVHCYFSYSYFKTYQLRISHYIGQNQSTSLVHSSCTSYCCNA